MLHPIPDSSRRADLIAVVEIQQQLLNALCGLNEGSSVDCTWLQEVWNTIPPEWVESFWNWAKKVNNVKIPLRPPWINRIATASREKKQIVRKMVAEQLRFNELYINESTLRLKSYNWEDEVLIAVQKLLESFYTPQFYKGKGFRCSAGGEFNKDDFIAGFNPPVRICPYTDDLINDTELDHFLPKSEFPMLSCHPDNLIPCSPDANKGSHKGKKPTIDIGADKQAENYFHPRLRPATGKYHLTFLDSASMQPVVRFVAIDPVDQPRLDNMNDMFKLSEFWGRDLETEVQLLASDISSNLQNSAIPATEANVSQEIDKLASQAYRRIGHDALSIVKHYFYRHIARTPILLNQIVRTCGFGT